KTWSTAARTSAVGPRPTVGRRSAGDLNVTSSARSDSTAAPSAEATAPSQRPTSSSLAVTPTATPYAPRRRSRSIIYARRMLDDRVRSVLARMEAEDAADREKDLPVSDRSLAVGPDSGRLLFALVAPNAGCEVLEIGGSRGYSTMWLASAARILGGRVVTLEQETGKIEAWRRNIADAGLEEWAELVGGGAREALPERAGAS